MKQWKLEVKLQSESSGCLFERAASENKQILRRSFTVCLSIKQNGVSNNPTHHHHHGYKPPVLEEMAEMKIQDTTICSG